MLPPERIAEAQGQRRREVQGIIARLEGERAACEAQLANAPDQTARARLETEIVHLALALGELRRGHYSAR